MCFLLNTSVKTTFYNGLNAGARVRIQLFLLK